MTAWPRWARGVAPGALAQYVHRDVVARLLPADLASQLPGPSDDPAWHRTRRIYEIFAERDIGYVHEPTSSEPGRQTVRPPDQVLAVPRTGTCLDLAVTFCGACLDAGLHPLIVALDSARGGAGHAVVVVWLNGTWAGAPHSDYPWGEAVHQAPPAGLVEQLRGSVERPGAFLAIDVASAAHRPGDAPTSWEAAVARGTEMLTAARSRGPWVWGVAVDIGVAWRRDDVLPLPRWPRTAPLAPPYLPPEPEKGPLMQLRARRSVVPFYGRDQLDVLLDWCQAPDAEQRTRIALVHGVGGAGKTHLAAELARRLADEGWYTGFLRKHADPADLEWLAEVVSPLLVVVDYPEDVRAGMVISLLQALGERAEPACVVLTSRALGAWWNTITGDLNRNGVPYTPLPPLELPRRHPSVTGVFRRALRAFTEHLGAAPVEESLPPSNPRWTTLDLVMLAWLAAQGTAALPTSPEQLYDEILEREFNYWTRVSEKKGWGEPPERLLPAVGACVTLLAPTPQRVEATLRAVPMLEKEDMRRAEWGAVVETLLPADSDTETVALRPDPIGERLILRELGSDDELLTRCLDTANADEQLNACLTISRAAERNEQGAADMAARMLRHHPSLWRPVLAVVAAQGGPFTAPLLALADRDDSSLPLAELSETIPLGHTTLCALALVATRRSQPPDPADPLDLDAHARVAGWRGNLSNRLGDVGDRAGALEVITEAVTGYRRLAEANPAAYLPNLAASLNNLSGRLSETGDRTGALEAITEAVTGYRRLAEANPAAYLPDLAASLNNLSGCLSETGDRAGALEAITEAVTGYRRLAEAPGRPGDFHPRAPTERNVTVSRHSALLT